MAAKTTKTAKTTKSHKTRSALRIPGLIRRGNALQLRVFIDGRAKYRTLDCTADAAVSDIAIEAERARAELLAPAAGLSRYIEAYALHRGLRPNSIIVLRQALRGFTPDDDATNAAAADAIQSGRLRDSTKRLYMQRISTFYTWLHTVRGLPVANPVAGRRLPKAPDTYRHTVTAEDAAAVLDYIDSTGSDDDRLFVRLLRYTGARCSSIAAICPADFEGTDDGSFYVHLRNVKSGREYRAKLLITDATTCALIRRRLTASALFTAPAAALHARLSRRMHRVSDVMTPHSLRHLFATELLQQGVPLDVISRLLDHADISVTLKTYATHSQAQLDDAVRKI